MNKWKKCGAIILCTSIITAVVVLVLNYLLVEVGIKNIDIIIGHYKNIIDLLGVIISISAIVSVVILVGQIKKEYERARREKTLDLLMAWSTNLTPETNFAVKIVEKFNRDQCTKLFRMEMFEVSGEVCYEIKTVYSDYSEENQMSICRYLNTDTKKQKQDSINCNSCKCKSESEKVVLDKYYMKKLRYSILQYLNLLEAVLLGWQNGVIDREVVEQQFSFLHDPANNKNCLQDFRIAAGSESAYPSIEAFCVKLEENRKKRIKGKDYIA